jgi:hypothetical protein
MSRPSWIRIAIGGAALGALACGSPGDEEDIGAGAAPLIAAGEPVLLSLPTLGLTVEREKLFDPETGAVVGRNTLVGSGGRRLSDEEVDDLRREDVLAYRGQHGAVAPDFLAEVLEAAVEDPESPMPVVVFGIVPPEMLPAPPAVEQLADLSPEEEEALSRSYIARVERAVLAVNTPVAEAVGAAGGRGVSLARVAPAVFAEMFPADILALARQTALISWIYPDSYDETTDELSTSVCSIGADTVQEAGMNAGNVEAVVLEGGRVDSPNSCLDVKDSLGNASLSTHATAVAGVIGSTASGLTGVATGANILSADIGSSGSAVARIADGLVWGLDNGADVYNMSFATAKGSGKLRAEDMLNDWFVRFLRRTIAKAAGNIGKTCTSDAPFTTSPGVGYNVISVGNYDDNGTCDHSDDVMNGSSCFKDPKSPHGDRQKPEVAAPGTNITTTGVDNGMGCSTTTSSGTSFATPHVTGTAALLMKRDIAHKWWPELTKAVLMATAFHNIEGASRLSDKDGAGGIDAGAADAVTDGGQWIAKVFTGADFDAALNFDIPLTISPLALRFKAAIAWDSVAAIGIFDGLATDFDLSLVCGGELIAASASYDNSYEVIDVSDPPSGACVLRVHVLPADWFELLSFGEPLAISWATQAVTIEL